jgi:hypothetical protein
MGERGREVWEKEKWVGGKNNKKRKVVVGVRVCPDFVERVIHGRERERSMGEREMGGWKK